MRNGIILLLSAIFFIIALKSRIAGLYTYWWFAIFRPHDWVWGAISSFRLPLIAFVLLVIPSFLQKKYPRINHPLSFLMLLWLVLVFIADQLNGCAGMLSIRTNTVLDLAVLFYVVLLSSELITDKKKIYGLMAVMALSIGFHSGKGGLYAIATGADFYGISHLRGLFTGSNGYALGSGLLLFFMIFTFQHIHFFLTFNTKKKWYNNPFLIKIFKFFLFFIIFGTYYNIIALQSRGSFLATTAGLFLWLIFQKNMARTVITVSLIAIIAVNVIELPEGYTKRIESAFVEEDNLDKSAASRPHFWKVAINIVNDHPLGIGPGCYPEFYRFYDTSNGFYGLNRSVHSSHFQILSDSGYLGILIWILLFIISYFKLWKIKQLAKRKIKDPQVNKFYSDIAITLICSQTAFLLGGAFYEYAYNDITWLIFGLVIAIERTLVKELEEQEKTRKDQPGINNRLA